MNKKKKRSPHDSKSKKIKAEERDAKTAPKSGNTRKEDGENGKPKWGKKGYTVGDSGNGEEWNADKTEKKSHLKRRMCQGFQKIWKKEKAEKGKGKSERRWFYNVILG